MSALSHHRMNGVASPAGDIPAKSSFTSNCIPLAVICGLAGLGVGVLLLLCVWFKQKGKIDEIKRKNELDIEMSKNISQKRKKKDQDNTTRVVTTLQEHQRGLEEGRDQLNEQLEKLQTEKEENKKKLQSVEEEITEREKMFDKPEKLIRQKESLLKAQWTLDETKKNYERLQMKIENLLEPIEFQISTLINRREAEETWSD